ncbi:hypothetical protein GC163_14245 [bacterium]|nr:hypothetical protein [bacterium]
MSLVSFVVGLCLTVSPDGTEEPVSVLPVISRASLPDDVHLATEKFEQADHWRDRLDRGKELVPLGEPAVAAMLVVVRTADDQRLRRDALEWLRQNHPTHAALKDYMLTEGLISSDFTVRYESLWHVGEHRWSEARETLLQQMRNYSGEEWHRFVAAKSLAELGDTSSLRTLIEAAQHDRYMPRHFGNVGLKALTGKSLDDFAGYNYGEGAFVSGGAEATMANPDPLEVATTIAQRYTACRDYLQWLQTERPMLYDVLSNREFFRKRVEQFNAAKQAKR